MISMFTAIARGLLSTLDSMATNMAGNINLATVKREAASGSNDASNVPVECKATDATTVASEHTNKKTFDALLDGIGHVIETCYELLQVGIGFGFQPSG